MSLALLIFFLFIGMPILIVVGMAVLTNWDKKVQIADATYPNRLSYLNRGIRIAISFMVLGYAYYGYQQGYIVIPGRRSNIVLIGEDAKLGAWAAACFCAGVLMPVLACYLPAKWHDTVAGWPAFLFSTASILILLWAYFVNQAV